MGVLNFLTGTAGYTAILAAFVSLTARMHWQAQCNRFPIYRPMRGSEL